MSSLINLVHILESILDIAGFSKDKNEFIQQFLNNLFKQTVGDLLITIPARKQEEYLSKIKDISDPNLIVTTTNNFFDEKIFQTKLIENYQKGLGKLLKSIEPTLTNEQKKQFTDLKESIEKEVGKKILLHLKSA